MLSHALRVPAEISSHSAAGPQARRERQARRIVERVKLPCFPNPFSGRMHQSSCKKRLAWVNAQHETSCLGSPPWVIPHPGLSPLRRSVLVKRGPVRDEPGLRAEERPSGRARGSRGARFLPSVFFCGLKTIARIFHIFTAIHKEKEAKRKLLLLLIFLLNGCHNDHTRGAILSVRS
jgi:hypothetical protein